MTRIELTTQALHDLFAPVLPHVSPDSGVLPLLAVVRLRGAGTTLTADATDRYTLGRKRIHLGEHPDLEPFEVLIEWDHVAKLLRTFPLPDPETVQYCEDCEETWHEPPQPSPTEPLAVEITERSISVANRDLTWTAKVVVPKFGAYPNLDKLLGDCLHRPQSTAPATLHLGLVNAKKWLPACDQGIEPIRLTFAEEPNKPVLVTIGHDFIGAWMPCKTEAGKTPVELWGEDIPAPAQKDTAA
jgi:hypothetical protein